eukprot:COSAG02_NODE_192_length_29942_cov_34.627228_18_plen_173_part_00
MCPYLQKHGSTISRVLYGWIAVPLTSSPLSILQSAFPQEFALRFPVPHGAQSGSLRGTEFPRILCTCPFLQRETRLQPPQITRIAPGTVVLAPSARLTQGTLGENRGVILWIIVFVAELCVLRTFGGLDFSLIFICAQSVPEFLWDRLRASSQFRVMWGECVSWSKLWSAPR